MSGYQRWKENTLLILDSFSAHITNDVKTSWEEINTVPIVIPGGCTSKVQPLDLCLNKPFKAFVRKHWSEYIITQSEDVTSNKKLKPPQKVDVASWVSDALIQLQDRPDMVTNSFSACGISDEAEVHPSTLLEGRQYPDSDDEAVDNPFIHMKWKDLYLV